MPPSRSIRRRFFVSEVVQTSGMDCGPAALKALLEGFGVRVSYGRLREACHTDVDGTSIDTLEEIAGGLGLGAEQIMLPVDHVLRREADALPAIAVAKTASGAPHFIVIWRAWGPWVQIMDPARGRLWLTRHELLSRLFRHTTTVDAGPWREWAGTSGFQAPLLSRMRALGLRSAVANDLLQSANADGSWKGLATLDACVRMAQELRGCGALGRSSVQPLVKELARECLVAEAAGSIVPEQYWSVRPAGEPGQLRLRGAVLVRAAKGETTGEAAGVGNSPEIKAALAEKPIRPLREMIQALRSAGALAPLVTLGAIALGAVGVVFEALLLRSAVDVGALLPLPLQALAAGGALALFAVAMLVLEGVLASAERRAGSHLEGRLRIAFLEKIPRLPDSYFQSRPMADMLERSHGLHLLRLLPQLGVRFLRLGAELAVTAAAIVWLDRTVAILALAACAAAACIPLIGNAMVAARDLKVRTHAGALARFHLDALLGRTTIEANGGETVIESEHEHLLAEWFRASLSLQRTSVALEGLQMLVGFGLAGWLLFSHFAGGVSGAMLLMAYWVLNLPALGYELSLIAREYPAHRSMVLRLLEPLGAIEAATRPQAGIEHLARQSEAISLDFKQVSVRVAGHQVLDRINLQVEPGAHVAVVGSSGAGKSTLVGLLLGWYRPSDGELLVDGTNVAEQDQDRLRKGIAWVDPTIQIWNRSLLDNLLYGSDKSPDRVAPVIEAAALTSVIAKLPKGMATPLGEGGKLLSTGEGQRVRLGRAMMRDGVRLAVLDEPFLGLERDRRRGLLSQVRQRWSGTTLLYVTHDITETRGFDRVIVMDHGRIVEDGAPLQLAQMPSSRYRRLLQAQEAVHNRLTHGVEWRRVRLAGGRTSADQAGALEQRA